jgi:hypothetical protein
VPGFAEKAALFEKKEARFEKKEARFWAKVPTPVSNEPL